MALFKGNSNTQISQGTPKRSALLKSTPNYQPAEEDLGEFHPVSLGATKISGSASGRILRSKDTRTEQVESEEAEFYPQEAPQRINPQGKVLGNRRAETQDRRLPPILSASSVNIPTSDPPPPGTPPPPKPVTVDQVILEQAKAKAQEMIGAAQKQIQQMMQQANEQLQQFNEQAMADAEAMRQEAFKRGTEEGREEGKRLAHAEYVDLMLKARDLYVQSIKERTKLIEATEPELAKLSIKIAEKIIGLEINTSGDVIMGVVKEALSDMKDREQVRIHVNPDDYHIVNNDRTSLMRMVEGLKDFDLSVDSKVARGGCIIETNLGNIDARLETQLAAISLAFNRSSRGEEADDGTGGS